LRGFELGYHEALADLHRNGAALDRAVGRLPGAAVGMDAKGTES
jgi:hypothetical protein